MFGLIFNFVVGDISIPLNYKTYLSKENCSKHNKSFMCKSDIAVNFINSFEKLPNCDKTLNIIGEAISYIRILTAKEFVCFVYNQAPNYIPIEVIFNKLKLIS